VDLNSASSQSASNAAYTRGDRRRNRSAQLSAQAPIAERATVGATVGATGCADGCGKLSGNVNQLSSAPHLCTTSQFDFVNTTFEWFSGGRGNRRRLVVSSCRGSMRYYN